MHRPRQPQTRNGAFTARDQQRTISCTAGAFGLDYRISRMRGLPKHVSRIVVTGIGLPASTRGVLDLRFPLRWPRMGAVGALR